MLISSRFEPLELNLLKEFQGPVVGVDEAGRGPLAGPISLGLTNFSYEFLSGSLPDNITKLNDSKKLTEKVREKLYPFIKEHAKFSATVQVSSKIIDRIGIAKATEFAVIRLVRRCELAGIKPGILLMDGNYRMPDLEKRFPYMQYRSVIGGDSRIFSIAAASILAKVERDRRMIQFDSIYPGYDFSKHKGYGTKKHKEAIAKLGPAPLHRRSYTW